MVLQPGDHLIRAALAEQGKRAMVVVGSWIANGIVVDPITHLSWADAVVDTPIRPEKGVVVDWPPPDLAHALQLLPRAHCISTILW